MRKQYKKPELYFEDFALAEAITNCSPGSIANATNGDTCYLEWPDFGGAVFNTAVNPNCMFDIGSYEGGGGAASEIFGS